MTSQVALHRSTSAAGREQGTYRGHLNVMGALLSTSDGPIGLSRNMEMENHALRMPQLERSIVMGFSSIVLADS